MRSFNDSCKIGEEHELPLNHTLANTKFPARALEIEAIRNWARINQIQLRSEYCIEIKETHGQTTAASVLTYDYKTQLEAAEPRYLPQKQVYVLEDACEMEL